MRVFSLKALRDFWVAHPDAERPLREWYKAARRLSWASLAQVRRVYPHADGVPTSSGETLTVFNIGGNKYRLIVQIDYEYRSIFVRSVLTHAEYDRGRWKES
jgi:mRNA interferase HigB